MAIKRTYYERKSAPYGSCRDDVDSYTDSDSKYFKATLKLAKYSKKLCYELCLQDLITENCSCSDPSIPITDSNSTFCKILDKLDCVNKVRDKFDSTDLSSQCEDSCPTECKRMSYETSIDLSDYPTKDYFDIISKQPNLVQKFTNVRSSTLDFSSFKQSVVMINVYFHDLSYTLISESPSYTWDIMLGSIGLFNLNKNNYFDLKFIFSFFQ